VADGGDGLEIIDVSNPATPTEIGQYDDGTGTAYGLSHVGDCVYLADGSDGLEIIAISNPNNPYELSEYNVGPTVYDVAVEGDLAFLAGWGDGVEIINVSSPANPTSIYSVGTFDDGGAARKIIVEGSYAYVADGLDGVEILDISIPETPVEIVQFDDGGSSFGIQLVGSYVYVADYEDGLNILQIIENTITISNPNSLSSWDTGTTQQITWASSGSTTLVDIGLFKNNSFQESIVSATENDGSYTWNVSGSLGDSDLYQIKINNSIDGTIYDFSDYFEIKTPEPPKKIPGFSITLLLIVSMTAILSIIKKKLSN
jgi:hypothetical protein